MDSQSFSFLDERQYFALRIEIHLYAIATANLIGRDEIGHGLNQQPFNRALQMPGAILEVGSFLQQEAFGVIRSFEDE